MEKTIELEIPLLLPDVKDEQDECLNRLEASLPCSWAAKRASKPSDSA